MDMKNVSKVDLVAIKQLRKDLLRAGVIASDHEIYHGESQTLEEVIAFLKQAEEGSSSERDYNEEFFDSSLDEKLSSLPDNQEENPMVKDYWED